MALIDQALLSGARQSRSCQIIGLSSRTLQRWRLMRQHQGLCIDQRTLRVQCPVNRLSEAQADLIVQTANRPEFADLAPSQIVPRLADQGVYIGSESTFYRVLRRHHQIRRRSRQRPAGTHRRPRALSANAPGQLLSWDITYLPTCVRGMYFYLYLFVDLYSRKIVGWQVFNNESAQHAAQLVQDVCLREQISPNQATLHSDNGHPMKGSTMLMMLRNLGVAPSFSRPAVSNDNPYSESLFKTLKYHRTYPVKPFETITQARAWVELFTDWYNNEHRHSAIQFITPSQRHDRQDIELLKRRKELYEQARRRHPERWSGSTRNWTHQATVHLNPKQGQNNDKTFNKPKVKINIREQLRPQTLRQLA